MSRDYAFDPELLRDDLAAYALGALEGPRRPSWSAISKAARRAASGSSWLRPAVELLPGSVEQRTPPRACVIA